MSAAAADGFSYLKMTDTSEWFNVETIGNVRHILTKQSIFRLFITATEFCFLYFSLSPLLPTLSTIFNRSLETKKTLQQQQLRFFLEKQERVRKRVFVDSVVAAQQWKRSQKKKERVRMRMRMTVTVAVAAAAEWKEWLLGSPLMLNTPLHVTQTTFCSRPLPNNRWVRFDAFFVSVRYSGWKLQLVWPITAITTIIIISSGLVKRNKKWSYDIWKVKANWHQGFDQKENKKEVLKY